MIENKFIALAFKWIKDRKLNNINISFKKNENYRRLSEAVT